MAPFLQTYRTDRTYVTSYTSAMTLRVTHTDTTHAIVPVFVCYTQPGKTKALCLTCLVLSSLFVYAFFALHPRTSEVELSDRLLLESVASASFKSDATTSLDENDEEESSLPSPLGNRTAPRITLLLPRSAYYVKKMPPGTFIPCVIPCRVGNASEPFHTAVDGRGTFRKTQAFHPLLALISYESPVRRPFVGYSRAKSNGYDIVGNVDTTSDVPLTYAALYWHYRTKPVKKNATALVAMFISNCDSAPSKRLDYIRELMRHNISVHSYGKCLHNRELPPRIAALPRNKHKDETIKYYKFTIAMENSNSKDYITEKLHLPLGVGSVPVYLGVPDVHAHAPPHSVISVHDFSGPAALAAYLLYLDKNDTAYNEYLAWKGKDFGPDFKGILTMTKVSPFCSVCVRSADILFPQTLVPSRRCLAQRYLWVREYGQFYYRCFPAPARAGLQKIKQSIISSIVRQGHNITGIWKIVDVNNRTKIVTSDTDFESLNNGTKLEVFTIEDSF